MLGVPPRAAPPRPVIGKHEEAAAKKKIKVMLFVLHAFCSYNRSVEYKKVT